MHVLPRTKNRWVQDEDRRACSICKKVFTMIRRKHHCRTCFDIICANCYDYVKGAKKCAQCIFLSRQLTKKLLFVFSLIPLRLHELLVLVCVCKRWKVNFEYIIGTFKAIQYKKSYEKWSKLEINLLKTHFHSFYGHSRLMIQCIRGLFQFNTNLLRYLHLPKRIQCHQLFCNPSICHATPTLFDFFELCFAFPSKEIFKNDDFYQWFGDRVRKMNSQWLWILFPWLLQWHPSVVQDFLLPLESIELTFLMYFECRLLKEHWLGERVLQESEYKDDLVRTEMLITEMREFPLQKCKIDALLPCRIPYDPNIFILKVCYDKVRVLPSQTKPIMIPVETTSGRKHILIKHDDVRKDRCMMILQFILMEKFQFEFELYNVMPISTSYGWIDCCESDTLFDILEAGPLKVYDEAKFVSSLASNALFCYLFGIGDRNTHNILITDSAIVNIDYAYLFGDDPKFHALTKLNIRGEFVNAIGGVNGKGYEACVQKISRLFSSVKEVEFFFHTFFTYLNVDQLQVRQHLRSRFYKLGEMTVSTILERVADLSHKINYLLKV